MAKLRIIDRPAKRDDAGTVPLYLRISHDNKTRYVSLDMRIKEKHWNRLSGKVRRTHRDHEDLNAQLRDVMRKADGALLSLKIQDVIFTADRIKDEIERALEGKETNDDDFLSYARSVVEGYRQRGQLASHERLTVILNKLEAFHRSKTRAGKGKIEIPFSALTTAYVRAFETYIIELHGNAPNTVAKNLKGLRTIVKRAISEGRMDQAQYPFFTITIRERGKKKTKLLYTQIKELENLELVPGSWEDMARDAFCFAFYAAGIRFGDLCLLTWENVQNGRLSYVMQKTGGQMSFVLPEPALAILEKYRKEKGFLFPFMEGRDVGSPDQVRDGIDSANTMVNKFLKLVAKKAKVRQAVSFHLSRHSFANHVYFVAGWSLAEVSKALGHSSLRQTETYLASLSDSALDEKMRSAF